jgi:class 3 adenylate cyclase
VNVPARLERLAEPGGVVVSARVREDAEGKLALDAEGQPWSALPGSTCR